LIFAYLLKVFSLDSDLLCLCCSGLAADQCCERYISGQQNAPTAEALMRSRFTAFAKRNEAYLLASWDKSTRPDKIDFSKNIADWSGLEILMLKKGQRNDNKGVVEFKAFYRIDGEEHVMHEISRFRKRLGRWFYLDGKVKSIAKPGEQIDQGRNALCACGSGKKFKRCCGKNLK